MKKLFVFATAVCLAAMSLSCSSERTLEDNYKLVKKGMKRDQVVAILGKPTGEKIVQPRREAVLSPVSTGEGYETKGMPYQPEIIQVHWKTGDKVAAICFEDGVVQSKDANWESHKFKDAGR